MKVRFLLGLPAPLDPTACGVSDWAEVRGTRRIEASAESVIAFCAGSLALAALAALAWYAIDGQWRFFPPSMLAMVVLTAVTVPLHEAVHFLALPATVTERGVGLFPGGAFVSVRGAMSRSRALVVLLAPCGVLTIGPFLWRLLLGPVNEWVVFLSIINAGGAVFDVHRTLLIAWQVPGRSAVHFGTAAIRYESLRTVKAG